MNVQWGERLKAAMSSWTHDESVANFHLEVEPHKVDKLPFKAHG